MGPVSRKRSLSANCQVRSSLASLLPLSLVVFSCARFTSERQQKVSVLHLRVDLAFNKQSGRLSGRWEEASAGGIWCEAPAFPLSALIYVVPKHLDHFHELP